MALVEEVCDLSVGCEVLERQHRAQDHLPLFLCIRMSLSATAPITSVLQAPRHDNIRLFSFLAGPYSKPEC